MVSTNRYNGLIYIKEKGFPVPDFIRIDSANQLSNFFFDKPAPFGWTLRTCKRDGENEMYLFYKNNISKKQLLDILHQRLNEFTDEFYIVYLSWDFHFSFNIIKTKYQYIIEGKFGSQKGISSGIETDFISFQFDRFSRTFQGANSINIDSYSRQCITKTIQYLEGLISCENTYSEVAITKNKELFFYEFWNIDKL